MVYGRETIKRIQIRKFRLNYNYQNQLRYFMAMNQIIKNQKNLVENWIETKVMSRLDMQSGYRANRATDLSLI